MTIAEMHHYQTLTPLRLNYAKKYKKYVERIMEIGKPDTPEPKVPTGLDAEVAREIRSQLYALAIHRAIDQLVLK